MLVTNYNIPLFPQAECNLVVDGDLQSCWSAVYGNKCFALVLSESIFSFTRSNCQSFCQQNNGNLANIHSYDEHERVVDFLDR